MTDIDVKDYTAVTMFQVDTDAKTYLEKEVGVQQATRIGNEANVWHFVTRFFRPSYPDEFTVSVSVDGRVVGFSHSVTGSRTVAQLTRQQALSLAIGFRDQVIHPEGHWDQVAPRGTGTEPHSEWHVSFHRSDGANPSGSQESLDIGLFGDKLMDWQLRLIVPDAWSRTYEQGQASKLTALRLDYRFGYWPLAMVAVVAIIVQHARGSLRRRSAVTLSLVGGLLMAAWYVNCYPLLMATRPANFTTWEIIAYLTATTLLVSLVFTLLILLFALAGPWLYRTRFPTLLAFGPSFTWRGVTTRQGTQALVVGTLAAPVFLAYQVLYYVGGRFVGIWSPADLLYDNLYSAYVPWLLPLSIGYMAAMSEELAFRMFAIPLLLTLLVRFTGRQRTSTWIAIIVSAAIWALLHSTYPQDPVYARWVELTVGGTFLGWLFVRYGILASVCAHYALDGLLMATSLTHAPSLVWPTPAHLLAVMPLVIAGVASLVVRRRGYTDEAPLLNAAQPVGEPWLMAPRTFAPDWHYHPLSRLRMGVALGYALAGAVGLGYFSAAYPHPFTLDRRDAIARADAVLAQEHIDVSGYRKIATVDHLVNREVIDYTRKVAGPFGPRAFYGDAIPPVVWRVHYLRDQPSSELTVEFRPNAVPGAPPFSVSLDTDDDATLPKLTEREAGIIGSTYLSSLPGWIGHPVVPVERESRLAATPPEPAATSWHILVFERQEPIIGTVRLRATVQIVGTRVLTFRPYVSFTDQKSRANRATTEKGVEATVKTVLTPEVITRLYAFVFVCLAIRPLVTLLRTRAVPWKVTLVVAAVFVAVAIIDRLNTLPTILQDYDSEEYDSMSSYVTSTLMTGAMSGVLKAAGIGMAAGLALALWRASVAPTIIPVSNRRGWARETVTVVAVLPLAAVTLWTLAEPVASGYPAASLSVDDWAPPGIESYVPALAVLNQIGTACLAILLAIVMYHLLHRVLKREWLTQPVALLLVAGLPAAAQAGNDLQPLGWSGAFIAGIAIVAIRLYLRTNLIACVGVAISLPVMASVVGFLSAPNEGLVLQGTVLLALWTVALAGSYRYAITPAAEAGGSGTLPTDPPHQSTMKEPIGGTIRSV